MSKLIQTPKELEKHILLKHALDRVLNLYSVERVYVYPIVDVLKLIIQRPVIVSFFSNADGTHLVYTSTKDPETLDLYAVFLKRVTPKNKIKLSEEISMMFYIFNDFPEEGQARLRELTDDEFENLKAIVNALFSKDNDGKRRKAGVTQAVREYEKKFGPDQNLIEFLTDDEATKTNKVKNNVSDEDVVNFRESMRRIVDLSMNDFDDAILVRKGSKKEEKLPFSNLFFVFRFPWVRESFDYSAQVMLSTKQSDEISSWWKRHSPAYDYKELSNEFLSDFERRADVNIEEVIKSFISDIKADASELSKMVEIPLSFEATSIADSIFKSGDIDFSHFAARQGLDWNAYQETDIRRQLAEHIIYSRITDYRHPFYIPIHVGGSPWLLVFTMPPQRYDKQTYADWKHNLNFYVDFIPFLSNKIRATVKELYLTELSKKIEREIEEFLDGSTPSVGLLCGELNKSIIDLMKFFPYDALLFYDRNVDFESSFELPTGESIWFKRQQNKFFERQVVFDLIDNNDLRKATEEGVRQASIKHKHLYTSLLRHQHTIFNLTPANVGLMNDALEVWDDSQKAKRYVEEARRASEVLSVVLSIIFESEIENFKSVVELIEFLYNHNSLLGPEPEVEIEPSVKENGLPLDQNNRGNAFLVLWNFWSNASKKYPGVKSRAFSVRLGSDKRGTVVQFKNEGEMPKSWVEFLLGNVKSPGHESENRITLQGLEVVVSALHDLGWSIAEARSEGGKTIVVVLIPNPKGE